MARRPDLGYFEQGKNLLDSETYKTALRSFGEAEELPEFAFGALNFALLEDEAIWTRDWVGIGTVADIPGAGDVLPFTVGNHGIHVQRLQDGTLEGRFNNAQHGGCRFVPVQCQGGTKTKCSFTSCGYSRDRDAIAAQGDGQGTDAMHQYLGLRPERLLKVSVATLGPLILVNVDGPGTTFAPDPAVSGALLQSMLPGSACTGKRWLEYDCNWKQMGEALVSSHDAVVELLPGTVIARRTAGLDQEVTSVWLFPNVVILSSSGGYAIVVLQQTALRKVLCRIQTYSVSSTGPGADAGEMFLKVIEERARKAVARQSSLPAARPRQSLQRDVVGYWAQTTLIDRVLKLPKLDHDAPMFQSTRHYSI